VAVRSMKLLPAASVMASPSGDRNRTRNIPDWNSIPQH
jgi:hypothetical protein